MINLQIAEILLFPGLTFFVWIGFLFDWLERKTQARMQGRRGPILAGPHGILQPVADFFKLASKEEIIPEVADKFIFLFGPPLFFAAPAIGTIFIPVLGPHAIVNNEFDLLFVLFILAFTALMATMLGYAAGGRWSIISVGRLVVQYTGYEVPLIVALVTPAVLAHNLSIDGIVAAQQNLWFIVRAPLSFIVFIIATLAELEKPPFDIPNATTEIVGGWMTEFSGRPLGYIKLTKDLSYAFLSALAVSLFLGGPLGPVLFTNSTLQSLLYFAYFMVKLFAVGFLIFTIKTALARIKIGQAVRFFWMVITPLSLIQLGIVMAVGW
ncbi:MAG: complex I subunit 1 family protein [Candidatus Bathyarchaeia archaeon]|jgi:NADH-quinone oxidoreductase subunit H